jgi:hypothetical protein
MSGLAGMIPLVVLDIVLTPVRHRGQPVKLSAGSSSEVASIWNSRLSTPWATSSASAGWRVQRPAQATMLGKYRATKSRHAGGSAGISPDRLSDLVVALAALSATSAVLPFRAESPA